MLVRVPAILEDVLARNPQYPADVRAEIRELAESIRSDRALPACAPDSPHAATWNAELAARRGHSWLATDWFFAETYAYRQLIERARYFGERVDPFISHKDDEYRGHAHAEAFARALAVTGSLEQCARELLGFSLFGNRIDLSFAASRAHGAHGAADDLLVDARAAAVQHLLQGHGALHWIADNAGTELTLDLVTIDFALRQPSTEVVLHLKVHPTFVSDATIDDVQRFLRRALPLEIYADSAQSDCVDRLARAVDDGRLQLVAHPYWNGPLSLSELPADLRATFASARLVVLKGDANYRRALNDALWPSETPFAQVTAHFPAPLLALRTLKSDPIVDLLRERAAELEHEDPSWRVNGRRGVASLGGMQRR